MAGANIPQGIRFELRDEAQGLTHPVSTVTYLFEDDPAPLGSDDGALTVVVDFANDGSRPINVHSLTSTFMVSEFEWKTNTKEEDASGKEEQESCRASESSNDLLVKGIALERENGVDSVPNAESSLLGPRKQFSIIQRDAHALSTRVSLVKQSLENIKDEENSSRL